MYVPSGCTIIVPLTGGTIGVVFTTSVVPSGSESAALVMSPETGVSSFVTLVSSLIIGASFTAVVVTVTVAVSQAAGKGKPLSHT